MMPADDAAVAKGFVANTDALRENCCLHRTCGPIATRVRTGEACKRVEPPRSMRTN